VARDITLLFVDEHVVVADKPSGLLVHRGWGNDDDVALFRVRDRLGARVYPIHRLDRGTSGALVFARTREAAAALGRSFEARRTEKRYLALVRGVPPEAGSIDHAIPRSEDGPRVPALTHYRRLAASPVERCSLVLAMPETGRLHQVRRHLRHVSHPLLGDVKYGSGELNRHYRACYGLHRLALHAASIRFEHPASGCPLAVTAPIPEDLSCALEPLGLLTAALEPALADYSPNARTYMPLSSVPEVIV
jgi:tRNA pseudouridine65 synthase